MSVEAVDWLPDTAFCKEAIEPLFADLIKEWSDTWFSQAAVSITMSTPGEARQVATQRFALTGSAGSVELTARAKRNLQVVALGMESANTLSIQADRHILDVFAAEIAEDLVSRLNKEFANKSLANAGGHVGLELAVSGNEVLFIDLSRVLVGSYLTRRRVTSPKVRERLASRTKALGPCCVETVSVLGTVELTLRDLEGLCPGDVLVLDRSLNDAVDLKVLVSNRVIGRGRLQRDRGRTSIQL